MTPEDLLELMSRRRTIRDFTDGEVSSESLERIMQASTLCPSGADKLPFIIIKVLDPDTRAKIRKASEEADRKFHENCDPKLKKWFDAKGIDHKKEFLTKAPMLLIIAGDTRKPYWRESTWLSIAYVLLAIENEGLGTVTYTPSDTGFLNQLLDMPQYFKAEVILPVGHPMETLPNKKARVAGKVFAEKYTGE